MRQARRAAGERLVALGGASGVVALIAIFFGCRGGSGERKWIPSDAGPREAQAVTPGAPRPGMVWIPAGTFRAGTPPDRVPRVADEELPGAETSMHGYYIDLLPYPNEPAAIATSNVPRDAAQRLCEAQSKRLCTELEWERACKGPSSTTYEYGDDYRAATCGSGVSADAASKRPTGERLGCVSGFGVRDLHGGAYEWTSSAWGRGSTDADLGVLRGGNSVAGELGARCANAIGRKVSTSHPTMGFRCCAGSVNEANVDLTLTRGAPLERVPAAAAEPLESLLVARKTKWKLAPDGGTAGFARVWLWHPVPNEELVIAGSCVHGSGPLVCGAVVGRAGANPRILAEIETGYDYPDMAQNGDARHLRIRGLEALGGFLRDVTYVYGTVDVGQKRR